MQTSSIEDSLFRDVLLCGIIGRPCFYNQASFQIYILTMGKEQTIRQVEQQILKSDTYLFCHLQEKLQVPISQDKRQGVAKDHELMNILEILIRQTWTSVREKKIKVSQKYQNKLKMMTILSLFFGATVYNLDKLEKELTSKRQEVLNLLIEANIAKLVAVQIDEEQGWIQILDSKIRERESNQDIQKYISGKLIHIKDKNSRLESEIGNILRLMGGAEKEPEERPPPRRMMGMGMGMGRPF